MEIDFIKGIIPPILTPLMDNEEVDELALRNHIDFIIDNSISGILAFGSNSEFYMLTEVEMEKILKIIIDQVDDRVPVYMGVGAIRTSTCVRIAKMGIKLGAKVVSILQPMFIKPTDEELEAHFRTIAESIPDVPVILYNNPGKSGYSISQDTVERLSHTVQNLVGIKDSSGDLTQLCEFIRRNADVGFKVFSGKDTLIYAGLSVGAVGAVCSTANFLPELVYSIYKRFIAGDLKGSLTNQYLLNPIRLKMDEYTFPAATKAYANLKGRRVGKPFLPCKDIKEEQLMALRRQLLHTE